MKLALAMITTVAACGGAKPTPHDPTPPPAPSTVFELGEITVLEGDQPVLKIHANGSTEISGHSGSMKVEAGKPASTDSLPVVWKPGPTAKADGTLEYDGKSVQVHADGTLSAEGKPIPLTVTADAITVAQAGVSITLAVDGTLTLPPGVGPEKRVRVEGADTPGKRRLALALLAFAMGGGAKHKAGGEPPTATEPATP